MYTVIKRMEISAAHHLKLSYASKCEYPHGHNWMITVYCRSKELNADGMVVDFSQIKQAIKEKLDHQDLNEILPFNPTAENIATHFARRMEEEGLPVTWVEVYETPNNCAKWTRDR